MRDLSTAAGVLRWAARLTSLVTLTFVVLAATAPAGPPTAGEAVALLLFPGGVVIGFAIAWWREGLGAAISLASLATFYSWMAILDGSFPRGPYFVLLTTPAFLFLATSLLSRSAVQFHGAKPCSPSAGHGPS